jgi:hypothetical protein
MFQHLVAIKSLTFFNQKTYNVELMLNDILTIFDNLKLSTNM